LLAEQLTNEAREYAKWFNSYSETQIVAEIKEQVSGIFK
jgi:hypothetical protein